MQLQKLLPKYLALFFVFHRLQTLVKKNSVKLSFKQLTIKRAIERVGSNWSKT